VLVENRLDGREISLNYYAANPRSILGLYGALAKKPGTVLYETSGLDPLGVQAMHRIITEHLAEGAAIYLAWPYWCQEQLHHGHLPGSRCVTVTDRKEA
jgi:hypothetical protein